MIIWTSSLNGRHLLPSGQWNRDFFEKTTLTKLGVEIHLGHGGQPCPHHYWDWEDTDTVGQSGASSTMGTPGDGEARDTNSDRLHAAPQTEVLQEVDDMGEKDVFIEAEFPAAGKESPEANILPMGKTRLTVVDTSGVHTMLIWFCQCTDARKKDTQLFEMGLFPASFARLKTAFTFALLDGFILDNLECGTSAMNYYSKLRRITSSAFPHLVPDRYWELMRVARQWRQLKLLKWNGFGHERRNLKDGELALFCTACSQPGINATLPKEDDKTMPGWLYSRMLVIDSNFKAEHLHPAHPEDEIFKRVKDYTLCNALGHNTDGLLRALMFYDVNCQYNKYLGRRVEESPHLTIPSRMDIIPGIGLWHVHGHQDKCFVWYASNFIPGAGRIDGEIMEMLWATLNIISPSARGMSTPHRQECLNYQMNDCNFMKMICMGLFLSQKYKKAKCGVAKSCKAFNKLNDAADPEILHKGGCWVLKNIVAIALTMDARRMGRHPTETQTLDMAHRRIRLQHSIDEFVAGAARYLREEYDADDRIPDMDMEFLDNDGDDGSGSGDEDADGSSPRANRPRTVFRPKFAVIPLPSNLGIDRFESSKGADGLGNLLVDNESESYERALDDTEPQFTAVTTDSSKEVDVEGCSAYLYSMVWLAKSQVTTTWAWAQVHLVEWVINLNSMIYKKCRSQLSNLWAEQLLEKYLGVGEKRSESQADPNTRGQRNSTLPWFWSLDVQGDSDFILGCMPTRIQVYRVHWLQTKALCYAIRQAQLYRQLAEDAHARFAEMDCCYDLILFVWHLVWEAERFVFLFINMCATSNTSPALPEYLNEVMKMLMSWQMGMMDDDGLFQQFHTHQFDMLSNYTGTMRNRWYEAGPDPLLTNLRVVIRDDLEEFGTKLGDWLSDKMEDGQLALDAMACIESPVDDLHDAIAAFQQLLDPGRVKHERGGSL
ncbi:hypothetical protein EV702DRAFT_1049008 [Suillus placidus]|uniref:CxC2-like cysteine cluster KDZ transposase-associated domain-containing protein n=1 Tax=Suillus placidus TaxID=48579 RepID=A0A9P6ZNH6_9AGAM|nr:hypothetical protein EV702DRAFT_1049008 [Suillus placidus]